MQFVSLPNGNCVRLDRIEGIHIRDLSDEGRQLFEVRIQLRWDCQPLKTLEEHDDAVEYAMAIAARISQQPVLVL